MRKLLFGLLAALPVLAVAPPASAATVQTQVVNRGTVAFSIEDNGRRAVLARGGTSYYTFGWLDVDSYTLGSGVCASVSVNGGPWSTKGPGYYGIPGVATNVQVKSFNC